MLNDRTALMISLIKRASEDSSQVNLTSLSFRNNQEVDEYIRNATNKFTGITLLKSKTIQKAIKKGHELIRFSVELFYEDDSKAVVSITNKNYLKVSVKTDDTKKSYDKLLSLIADYKILCGLSE